MSQVRRIGKPPEVIDADFRAIPTSQKIPHALRMRISAAITLPLLLSFGGAAVGSWSFKIAFVGAVAWMCALHLITQWASPPKAHAQRRLMLGLLMVLLVVLMSGCGQQTTQDAQLIRRIDPGLTEEQLTELRAAEQARLDERKASLEKYRAEARTLARIPGALEKEVNKCRSENKNRMREGVFTHDLRCTAFDSYQTSLKISQKSQMQFQGGSLDYDHR